jgi:hypothetical protein
VAQVSDLVDPSVIEGIVGASRHEQLHQARAVSAEQSVYILHSRECVAELGWDGLRRCPFSKALDRGHFILPEDQAIVIDIEDGLLVPAGPHPNHERTHHE